MNVDPAPTSPSTDIQVFSVGQINSLARQMLETLQVWVEAEVSEFKGVNSRYYYLYFTLKDLKGDFSLPAVIVRQHYPYLGVNLENGQKILAYGKVSLFTKSGSYQFLISKVEIAGQGKLAAQLEQLKLTLQKEGLLDQARKKSLPTWPQKVGVITSIASDAWADFQRHSIEKFPMVELVVADAYVQGPNSPSSLIAALNRLTSTPEIEVIVITRGGGSQEDLSAFNDERVARAIASCPLPVVVGVGHEKDVSIADLVADVRASTPTNAGQIIVSGYQDALVHLQHLRAKNLRSSQVLFDQNLQQLDYLFGQLKHSYYQLQQHQLKLAGLKQRIMSIQASQLHHYQQRLASINQSLGASKSAYQYLPIQLTNLDQRLRSYANRATSQQQSQLHHSRQQLAPLGHQHYNRQLDQLQQLQRQLEMVSPLKILSRGYSIVSKQQSAGSVVTSSQQLSSGEHLSIRLHQGQAQVVVQSTEHNHSPNS